MRTRNQCFRHYASCSTELCSLHPSEAAVPCLVCQQSREYNDMRCTEYTMYVCTYKCLAFPGLDCNPEMDRRVEKGLLPLYRHSHSAGIGYASSATYGTA